MRQEAESNHRERKSVLIIDDDEEILKLIKRTLVSDFNVMTAQSNSQFRSLIEVSLPDIAIVDINLPGDDGFSCLRELKARKEGIKNIVLTGYATKSWAIQGIKHRVFDFIEKPFDEYELRNVVISAANSLDEEEDRNRAKEFDFYELANLGARMEEMIHEIASPLSTIMFRAAMLVQENGQGTDSIRKIHDMALRIASIMENARETAIGSSPEKSITSFKHLFEQALETCVGKINAANVHITSPRFDHNPLILCNPLEISQVIVNLINSAIDNVAQTEHKEITIELEITERNLMFQVADSGENRSGSATTQAARTRIGINLAKRVAVEHGGRLESDETSDRTCHILFLPLAD